MVSQSTNYVQSELPLPECEHLEYLDHVRTSVLDLVQTLSYQDRQGLLVVSMYPLDAEIDDAYVSYIGRDDLSLESIGEYGIHRDEAQLKLETMAVGLPDTEMWLLMKEPSCGLTTFSFLPIFVGESFEAKVLQLRLFEDDWLLSA